MSTAIASPWGTKANDSEGGDFELPPVGVHPGFCIGLIDLGTHEREYQGKKSDVHKIMYLFELTAEHDSKGQTFVVAIDFTWSLGKKAKLRPFLEGLRGKSFTDDEHVNIDSIVGQPCCITLMEGMSGSGKKYVEIANVSPPMKNLTVPPPTRPAFIYSLADNSIDVRKDPEIPEWVPRLYGRLVKDDIKASQEWGKLTPF